MAEQCRAGSPGAISAGLLPETGDSPRVLILGSFPSIKSLEHCEYYGNPQNHFWKIMEALFTVDHSLPYRDRIASLTGQHVALWDVVRSCSRKGSADEEIREPVLNDISGFLSTHPTVQLIVLNGTAASRYYRRMMLPVSIEHRILPSTSPANARYTLAEKTKAWKMVRETCEKEE